MKKLKLNKQTISIISEKGQQKINGGISTVWVCANSMQQCETMPLTCRLSCHKIDGMCTTIEL